MSAVDQLAIPEALETHVISDGATSISVSRWNSSDELHTQGLYWRWMQLFERDPIALIQQHPDFVEKELQHDADAATRPAFLIEAVHGGQTVSLAIVVPKIESARNISRLAPNWQLKGYRLAGNRILGDQSAETARLLLTEAIHHVQAEAGSFLLIEDLITDSEMSTVCETLKSTGIRTFQPQGVQARWGIRWVPGVDYWSRFNSKRRWNFRHKIKKFGELRVERIDSVDDVADFLTAAHEISRNSWQANYLGVRIQNDDAEAELLTFLAQEGALRSYLLFQNETPVAFIMGTQFRGYFDHAEIAFDQRFAKQGPGQVLFLKAMDDLLEHNTPEFLDFGGGDNEFKSVFGNESTTSGNLWLLPTGFRSQLVLTTLRTAKACDKWARGVLAKLGAYKKVRSWMRGNSTDEAE